MFPSIPVRSGARFFVLRSEVPPWLQLMYGLWLVVFLWLCVPLLVVQAAEVTLAWDANTESNLGGYRLHYGQASGRYDANVDVGNQTRYTLASLEDAATYYFAVTAYDSAHTTESGFSNEISKTFNTTDPDDEDNPGSGRVTQGQRVLYGFTEGGGTTVRDLSGVGEPLDLMITDPGAVSWRSGGGLVVNSATVIRSAGAATKVNQALKASQALTLEAWVVPGNTSQGGPARIVALSKNGQPDGSNFMLGQEGNDYRMRLRTDQTDQYGKPELSTPSASTVLAHVVYTRDTSGMERVYIDGVERVSGVKSGSFSNWGDYALALVNEPELDKYGNGRPWLGELHLVAIYDRALETSEVERNFAAGERVNVTPTDTVEYTFTTQPNGLTLGYGGVNRVTPFTVNTEVGSQQQISAPEVQQDLLFSAWSDGGAATHTITIGTSAKTFTATYVAPATSPVADFNASSTSGTLPLSVTFSDASTGEVTDWLWEFGDGNSSSERNPSHTYQTAGIYTVTLTATGPGGTDTLNMTNYISVTAAPPVADFSASPISGTAPLLVTLRDASTGEVTDWSWSFGDGGTSVGQNALYTYNVPGTYAVSLTVTGPGGSDTLTKTNYISVTTAPPVAGFSASSTSGTVPLKVNFSDTSTGDVTDCLWEFGDGNGSSEHNPSHTYETEGTYAVSLTVTGPGGSDTLTKAGYVTVSASTGNDTSSGRVAQGQVVLYGFTEGSGATVRDLSGVGEALDLTITDVSSVSWLPEGGLAVNSATVIRTAGAATKVNQALKASQALTLEAWVVPNNTSQGGPARIVALSDNGYPDGGNFMLGQEGNDYRVRLRTSMTDQYGKPALSTPSVSMVLTHVVYTRDADGMERFYIDGIEQARGVKSGNFSNWGNYALALANEPVGKRPWLGELHLVAIYDRALDATEVEKNFTAGIDIGSEDGGDISSRVTQGQLALYGFTEGSGSTVRDLSGVGQALDLTIADVGAVSWLSGGGLAVNSATVIRTAGAATKVNQALQASQALTVEAWVVPGNTSQWGPARIVALSDNGYPDGGNFMLGQDKSAYDMRLRTDQTNKYGKPALSTPSVSTVLTHVVYARDADGMERLYINGIEQVSGVKSGTFSNWGDYALALANEPVGKRPWLGELHLVAIYDRALEATEVEQNFAAGIDVGF